jgi:hypothetical protein
MKSELKGVKILAVIILIEEELNHLKSKKKNAKIEAIVFNEMNGQC